MSSADSKRKSKTQPIKGDHAVSKFKAEPHHQTHYIPVATRRVQKSPKNSLSKEGKTFPSGRDSSSGGQKSTNKRRSSSQKGLTSKSTTDRRKKVIKHNTAHGAFTHVAVGTRDSPSRGKCITPTQFKKRSNESPVERAHSRTEDTESPFGDDSPAMLLRGGSPMNAWVLNGSDNDTPGGKLMHPPLFGLDATFASQEHSQQSQPVHKPSSKRRTMEHHKKKKVVSSSSFHGEHHSHSGSERVPTHLRNSTGKIKSRKARKERENQYRWVNKKQPSYQQPTTTSMARSSAQPITRSQATLQVIVPPSRSKSERRSGYKKKKNGSTSLSGSPMPAEKNDQGSQGYAKVGSYEDVGRRKFLPTPTTADEMMTVENISADEGDDTDDVHEQEVLAMERRHRLELQQLKQKHAQKKTGHAHVDSLMLELSDAEADFDYDVRSEDLLFARARSSSQPDRSSSKDGNLSAAEQALGSVVSPDLDISQHSNSKPCRKFTTPPIPRTHAPFSIDAVRRAPPASAQPEPVTRGFANVDKSDSGMKGPRGPPESKETSLYAPLEDGYEDGGDSSEYSELEDGGGDYDGPQNNGVGLSPLPISKQLSGIKIFGNSMNEDDIADPTETTNTPQASPGATFIPALNFEKVKLNEDQPLSTPKRSSQMVELGSSQSAFQNLSARSTGPSSTVSSARSHVSVTSVFS